MRAPIVDCTLCGRHFAAFNISWHLWRAHRILLKGAAYAKVYWSAVNAGRITYPERRESCSSVC